MTAQPGSRARYTFTLIPRQQKNLEFLSRNSLATLDAISSGCFKIGLLEISALLHQIPSLYCLDFSTTQQYLTAASSFHLLGRLERFRRSESSLRYPGFLCLDLLDGVTDVDKIHLHCWEANIEYQRPTYLFAYSTSTPPQNHHSRTISVTNTLRELR